MAASQSSPDLTGTLLGGRYRVKRLIGMGGMGAVYEAVQEDLGRRVAVKVVHAHLLVTGELLERFKREAQAAAALGHPNIVQITDFESNAGEPAFLVMEYLTGVSLGQAIRTEAHLGSQRVAFIASQTLAALAAAHAAGIVHRDIKPDNIFLTSISGVGDIVKVLDFGVAKLQQDAADTRLTTTGAMVGTPMYMAPEQARGKEVDGRTDLYAVGACMYHALSGRVPFDAPSFNALLFAIAEDAPLPLATLRPDLDPALVAVVERALAKRPGDRFEDADAMRDALASWAQPYAGGVGVVERVTAPPDPLGATVVAPTPPFGSDPRPRPASSPPSEDAPAARRATPRPPPLRTAGVSGPSTRTSMQGAAPAIAEASPQGEPVRGVRVFISIAAVGAAALGFFFLMRTSGDTGNPTAAAVASTPAKGENVAPRDDSDAHELALASASQVPTATMAPTVMLAVSERAATLPAPPASSARASAPIEAPATSVSAPHPAATTPSLKRTGARSARFTGGAAGPIDLTVWRAAVTAQASAVNACYAASEYDPVDHQFMYWHLGVDANGNVTRVSPIGGPRSPKLDACMAPVLARIRFGPLQQDAGATVEVNFSARLE